jgi:hypothetical protein
MAPDSGQQYELVADEPQHMPGPPLNAVAHALPPFLQHSEHADTGAAHE